MDHDEIDENSSEQLDRLLAAAQNGDPESLNELFSALHKYLAYLASQYHNPVLGGKLGASDIVQQTMLHAAKEFKQFRGQSAFEFRGWIRQILVNETRELNRHYASKKRNAAQEIAIEKDSSGARKVFEIADECQTPSVLFSKNEDSQKILELLGKMPEDLRQVVQLRNWEGLQFSEIAARMGITISRASKLWYNALLELERLHSESDNVQP